jgi:[acyl-carrier-protein] S-malonyltransferase
MALAAGAKRAVPLKVSAPFHCALMKPAAARLRPVLDAAPFRDPSFPVYTNVEAAPVSSGPAARELLIEQVASSVRWEEEVERMVADGIDTFVEFGPGKVLGELVRKIQKDAQVVSIRDGESLSAVLASVEV